MKRKQVENALGLAVISTAILVTAFRGNTDWMGLALLAVLFKLPGTRRIARLFDRRDDDDRCDPRY